MSKQWDTVTIVGVGLIGGSIGLGLRERGLAQRVIGVGRRASSLKKALDRGAVTKTTTSLRRGTGEADLIVVCTPVAHIAATVRALLDVCNPETLVTDAGSTKAEIVAAAESSPMDRLFVGSHPMAGSEKAGPEHAQADLFNDRTVVVTTTRKTNRNAADRIVEFWESLGAHTVRMSPAEHDATVAATSHLPHLIATALAAATTDKQLPMTASGWADTTRVAAGDPELWRQILMQNRGHVLKSLDKFGRVLSTLRQALAAQDHAKLLHLLESGKDKRDAVGN